MASSATTSSLTADPTTPAYSDDVEWVTAYFVIHMLSDASRRYAYLLWLCVVFIFLIFAILHWSGSRGGFVGAYWSKWALRRRTWRKKHSTSVAGRKGQGHNQPTFLPSNAQLLSLAVLFLASLALAFVGPDYIAPGVTLWQFYRPSTTLHTRSASYDTTAFYQFQPQYTISKAWWTTGGRTGLIAFALFPLCVLFALKAPPFAIFAIPFMIQLHFDKLAWLHRWSGRLIWLMTALHVALWSVQLFKDHRQATGEMAYQYAWLYEKFIYGWIAFGLLTLLILFSLFPLRRNHYETFYFLHVLLVPLTLITAGMHHPPVWWWCWAALALWVGERLWRGTWWLHSNGFFGGVVAPLPAPLTNTRPVPSVQEREAKESWELKPFRPHPPDAATIPESLQDSSAFSLPIPSPNTSTHHVNHKSPLGSGSGRHPTQTPHESHSTQFYHPRHSNHPSSTNHLLSPTYLPPFLPPPGYAHVELLSGRTARLRFVTPGFLSWAPGQHFLINIPSVSKLTSHPFTSASVCDEQAPSDLGREIVLLIRAKQGWTKDLFDQVVTLTNQGRSHPSKERPPKGTEMPHRGVLMRMYVDGPFGSAVRARWGNFSTVLVVAGGSGVSFGLSVLQYVCMCMAGRDGKHLGGRPGGWGKKGFLTTRVRFVWLIREYSHIQWCASILRQCMAMIPAPGLQVDIFVTNFKPIAPGRSRQPPVLPRTPQGDRLFPPVPGFAREGRQHSRSASADSHESDDGNRSPVDSLVDLSYYTGNYSDEELELEHGDLGRAHMANILDLTNFDGDDDSALPGEEALNRNVKKTGKLRRAKSRKANNVKATKQALGKRAQEPGEVYPYHNHASSRGSSAQPLLLSTSPPSDQPYHRHKLSASYEIDLGNPTSPSNSASHELPLRQQQQPPHSPLLGEGSQSPMPPFPNTDSSTAALRPSSVISHNWDARSDTASIRGLMPRTGMGASGEEVRLDVDEHEMYDVDTISEHARPGKPRIDRILADEIQQSQGSVVVACCGPASLNSMMRKAIASQIDPTRIRHGDARGSIALVSEEFEY